MTSDKRLAETMNDLELLAEIMLENGLATGHGDTLNDLLCELRWQLTEYREKQKSTDKTYEMRRFNAGVWDGNMPAELIAGKGIKAVAESILGVALETDGKPEQLYCEVWHPDSPIVITRFYLQGEEL